MSLTSKLNEFINLLQKEGNEDLYKIAVDLQKDIQQLIEENQVLQKKLDAKEGCYWDANSDGG